ncbi:Peptidyl-prolyl cis-trans isomerase CYP59 [Galdieria sulphuraria]|nr:Peptidyl-prolyl cis-trans isomerase CYP59 [Galdieria sulphuraria]
MPPIPSSPERDGNQNVVSSEVRLDDDEIWQEEEGMDKVLEIIGDIPDAEVKPPDNTLFVCKLNPVTRSEDLELIFSRFGECKAEIIKDKAFFKMNNCLIDDRRIRVDFSQSVAKLWNRVRQGHCIRLDEDESLQSHGKRSHHNEYVFDDLEEKALFQEHRRSSYSKTSKRYK